MADYDFVVDLSNVCRDDVLGAAENRASLRCLELVARSLAAHVGGNAPRLLLVADNSLWPLLEAEEGEARVRDFKARNHQNLIEVPVADQSILHYAESYHCPVLSMDQYRDWRTPFPWIQGNRDLFYGWRQTNEGEIEVFRRTMAELSDESVSRHDERRLLKGKNLDPGRMVDAEILDRIYRCENRACALRERNPAFLLYPPRKDRKTDRLVCPHCGAPVADMGRVGRVRQFRFEVTETTHTGRFTIYQHQPVRIGRKQLKDQLVDLAAGDATALQRISSEHIELLAEGDLVYVTDTQSSNGTEIQRFNYRANRFDAPELLAAGERTPLGRHDQLWLAGLVVLRRSGRQYRFDGLTQGQPEGDLGEHTQVRSR